MSAADRSPRSGPSSMAAVAAAPRPVLLPGRIRCNSSITWSRPSPWMYCIT